MATFLAKLLQLFSQTFPTLTVTVFNFFSGVVDQHDPQSLRRLSPRVEPRSVVMPLQRVLAMFYLNPDLRIPFLTHTFPQQIFAL